LRPPACLLTLKALNQLEKTIKAQRAQLLQAHGVLTCLYEVLLHADGEQAVPCALAADVAIGLIGKSAEELDSVRIWPLIEALASSSDRVEEPRGLYVN
jgi:hypothetical protein